MVTGDFNMITRADDEVGGNKFESKGDEQIYWNRMVGKLSLFDPLKRNKSRSKRDLVFMV